MRNEARRLSPPPRGKFTHISALLRFLASVMISWSRTETSSERGRSGGRGGGKRRAGVRLGWNAKATPSHLSSPKLQPRLPPHNQARRRTAHSPRWVKRFFAT